MRRYGGKGIYGWKMILFPRLFLQALHHAVWVSPKGSFVDITPEVRNWNQIVFAPDTASSFVGVPRPPFRPRFLNISGLNEVDNLIEISLRLTEARLRQATPNGALPHLDPYNVEVNRLMAEARGLLAAAQYRVGME
jgi:hypothetical protein